jgi:O-antigen/teichoic acid export membrane protein
VRYLGPANLGQYNFVLTFAGIFALFCDLGLGQLVIRQVSQDRQKASLYLSNYLYLQLLLSLVVFAIMCIILNSFHYSYLIKLAVYIAGINLIVVGLSQPFYNIAIAFERLKFIAVANILSNIFYCLCLLAAIFFSKGLLILISVTLATSVLELILVIFICNKTCVRPVYRIDKQIWLIFARFFAPFSLYLIFTGLYRRLDIVLLANMQSDNAVGLYSAAYKIVFFLLLIPTSFSKAIFPLLSERATKPDESFKKVVFWSMKYLLALSLPIALGGSFFSQKIVILLFGPVFSNSAIALSILLWSVVLVFWHSTLSQALIALNKMKQVILGVIVAFIVNLGVNLILIPKYSYIGASLAAFYSELIAGVWFYLALSRWTKSSIKFSELIKILIAGLVMVAILKISSQMNFFISLALGSIFYIITLFIMKFINPAEKALLREAFKVRNGSI